MGYSIPTRGGPAAVGNDLQFTRRDMLGLAAQGTIAAMPPSARAVSSGNQLDYGAHNSLAPMPEQLLAHGPYAGASSFGRMAEFPYTAPYEELTLKSS
jgi:hypothetical protein